jgi:hypothetical protein
MRRVENLEDRETGAPAHAVAAFLAFFSAFNRFFSSLESSAPCRVMTIQLRCELRSKGSENEPRP